MAVLPIGRGEVPGKNDVVTCASLGLACRDPGRKRVREREFFIDNLLVRIHCIIVMIR